MLQPVTNVLNSNAFKQCVDLFFTAKYIAVNNQKTVRLVLLTLLSKKIVDLLCKSELRTTLPFYVLGLLCKKWTTDYTTFLCVGFIVQKVNYGLHYLFKCWV